MEDDTKIPEIPNHVERPKPPVGIAANFVPQPNITAYEFSILFPYLLGQPLTEADWNGLGPITRHLQRK